MKTKPNNLFIFDLDGTLCDSKPIHFHSLNIALKNVDPKYVIALDDHLANYDGKSTSVKLEMLAERKKLPLEVHKQVWRDKQIATLELFKLTPIDKELISIFKKIKSYNIKIAVASNSIRETTKILLLRLGIMEYVDLFVSNEDVRRSKPYPDMFWHCMTLMDALPYSTTIWEDSEVGLEAARLSGANVIQVENRKSIDDNMIDELINRIGLTDGQKT